MKRTLLPLGFLLLAMSNLNAQQQATNGNINIANIIPPSPTAYSLGNYGNVPVGQFTGTANVSVPLLSFKTNNIELPLSLFYGSNGLRLDEVSTNVGLGWGLNCGGVISRTVRDKPDDTSQKLQVPANAFAANNTPAFQNFIYNVGNASDGIDMEADIYSFNFNDVSGKFFYDRDNQIHLIDQKALKIEKTTNGFSITKDDGEKYYFEEKEITNSKTTGAGHQLPNIGVTAWYLTKIVHPKGDEIYFTYESMYLDYVSSQSQNYNVTTPYTTCLGAAIQTPSGAASVVMQNLLNIQGKRIKTISSNNPVDGSITFTYSTNTTNIDVDGNQKIQTILQTDKNGNVIEQVGLSYLHTDNKRNFLTAVTFKDPNKSYVFDYVSPEQLPARLSLQRDYWGYYNGKANTTLLPLVKDYNLDTFNYSNADQSPDPNFAKIGLLRKITYPTKGYTELDYESNTYWGTKTVNPPYTTLNMTAANNSVAGIVTQTYSITSPVAQPIKLSGYSNFNGNCNEQEQTHNPIGRVEIVGGGSFQGSGNGGSSNYGSSYQFTPNQTSNIYFNASAGTTYTLKLSASRCTYLDIDAKYFATAPQVFDTNLETGGIRIKSTNDYDAPSSAPRYTRYYYGPLNDKDHSSGDKGTDPYFVYTYSSSESCQGGENTSACSIITKQIITLTSNSLLPLYDTDKNTSTFYKYVTVSYGGDQFERGGETKEFTINRDYSGSHLWGSNQILNTPYTNHGWNNGNEVTAQLLVKKADNSIEPVQRIDKTYEKDDASTFIFKNYTHRRNDLNTCQTSTTYNCTQYDVANSDHACYGKAVGTTISLPYIENLDVNEYRTISYRTYLKSQNKTDYQNGVPVLTQTEYFYNNPVNYQLSRQKVTAADGTITETNYSYAHEKGNQLMIDRNVIGIPLETVTTQTVGNATKTLARSETLYPTSLPTSQSGNLVVPLSDRSYDKLGTSNYTDITYDKYDAKGNILQYTTNDGTPVSFIYGYSNNEVIAKVEGIKYDDLVAALSPDSIVSASNDDASDPTKENLLLDALSNFRKDDTLKGKLVTTYTHDPLIGVTSVTPPSGIREVYQYDDFGRLKEVKVREKDTTGNYVLRTIKNYNYNYKP
ncbi:MULTISPECIES: hypothetical protein [Chryseobacterium]|uniref:YD repeat-containing protein n=1 Tax=Chryseobacterium camelliae TaxID=1265445 RepID=A0ABU0TN08_9FLAO|nr:MULTISPECIES: hypothetical protein [Chryseobacterium]MDQ1097685.1 YD repeat-containing protein [Chryseobacterium camelliae]MDQ1101615.1 YD repeat-containing protein [Chryseobacterium sp. SORGH_AS_1048]MDR6085057.1 YD repeat-containing protein [Chryseobacterium sp. SORGH_AS_0909]MDR6129412.1 YD repeat-containing protein [Chryseobacterium sp. SORGH_AS_1175]